MTAHFYDEANKQLHPYPAIFTDMIKRDVFPPGEFCVGVYDANELAAHEFTVTDGEWLKSHVRATLAGLTTEFMVKRWVDSASPFSAAQYDEYVNNNQ